MGTTPTYLLPYPEATDPADVPIDMRELAERVEAVLGARHLAYNFVTTAQTGIQTTPVLVTGLQATVTVAAGRRIRISTSLQLGKSGADTTAIASALIREGAVDLIRRDIQPMSAPGLEPVHMELQVTPTAGAHTYSVYVFTSAGFLNVNHDAGRFGWIAVSEV